MIRVLIKKILGPKFVDVPSLSASEYLLKAYESSVPTSPILLLLSPGGGSSDPLAEISRLAENKKNRRLVALSMGQGQGPVAEQNILEAVDTGRYIIVIKKLLFRLLMFYACVGGCYCKTATWSPHGCPHFHNSSLPFVLKEFTQNSVCG